MIILKIILNKISNKKYIYFLFSIICRIFGHKWKYNFSILPNKAICVRCKSKIKLDLTILNWKSVKAFKDENRTDSELCRRWYS